MLDQNQQLALLASVNEINLKLKCITLAVENPHLGTDNIKKAGEYYNFITTPTGLTTLANEVEASVDSPAAPAVNNANLAQAFAPFTAEELAASAAATAGIQAATSDAPADTTTADAPVATN